MLETAQEIKRPELRSCQTVIHVLCLEVTRAESCALQLMLGDPLDVRGVEQYPKHKSTTRGKSEKQQILLSTDLWHPSFALPARHSHIHSLQLTQFCFLSSCGGPAQVQSRALCLKVSKQGK